MTDVASLLRAERLALVDDLQDLTPGQWSTPSLCGAWTVQDVAAHLAWAPPMPARAGAVAMLRAGLRLNTMIADSAVRWSRRGPGAILEQLRLNAASGVTPIGMSQRSAVTDAVVHGLDIRRPLGLARRLPDDAVRCAADFLIGLRWPLSIPIGQDARRRAGGVRFTVVDLDWSHGHGPEVHATHEGLLLLLAGRPVLPGDLTGPGAAHLRGQG